jgi:hypothetical protein
LRRPYETSSYSPCGFGGSGRWERTICEFAATAANTQAQVLSVLLPKLVEQLPERAEQCKRVCVEEGMGECSDAGGRDKVATGNRNSLRRSDASPVAINDIAHSFHEDIHEKTGDGYKRGRSGGGETGCLGDALAALSLDGVLIYLNSSVFV